MILILWFHFLCGCQTVVCNRVDNNNNIAVELEDSWVYVSSRMYGFDLI